MFDVIVRCYDVIESIVFEELRNWTLVLLFHNLYGEQVIEKRLRLITLFKFCVF